MSNGMRVAGILLLGTALTSPSLAFAQEIPPGNDPSTEQAEEEALGQIDPAEDLDAGPEISVPGGDVIIVTGRRTRDPQRSSGQVLSILSAEDIARTGEGDIAGALTRVTGLSVVGNGRVFVRGLGDRYSLALLNGLPLPSPEPLSRVVPLDIFPTNVIASSLVQKTYSANFPGEFGGGVINLTTRAVPEESFLTLSAGIGLDTITSFNDGLTYFGSDLDPFGFDNGNRDIPSNLQAFLDSGQRIEDTPIATQEGIAGQIFPLNLVTLQKDNGLPPNFSGNIAGGTSFEIGDGTYLGVLATAGISNSWRNRNVRSQQATQDLATLTEDFTNFITDNNVLVNGLLSFGVEADDFTLRWTNLYIRDTLKTARLATGTRFLLGADGFDFINQNTAWFERQLIDTQLVGEFEFDRLSVDLRGGFAQTDREAPFDATFSYTRTNVPDDTPDVIDSIGEQFAVYLNRASDTGLSRVSFDDLREKLRYAGADFTYEFSDRFNATIGGAYTDTDRRSSRREFLPFAQVSPVTVTDADGNPFTFTPDPQIIPIIGLRRPGDIINGASLALLDITLDEANPFPVFDAALEIFGAYGKLTYVPVDPLTIEAGVRYETADQSVQLDQSVFDTPILGATPTALDNDYFLPGVTVTYLASDDLQFRLAASRTLARPQFRELVEQNYFDPESNRTFRGNPFLIDSTLFNAEARAEYYLGGPDKISLAAFYKKINDPIEAFVISSAGGGFLTSYANAPEAKLFGAELEGQYSFDLMDLGDFFLTRQFVVRANYTYTNSEIGVQAGDTTFVPPSGAADATLYFDDGDRLTGQSDHVANLQLGLEDTERTSQLTLLLNYASDRVTSRGFQQPDVIEDPGLTVDLVGRQAFTVMGKEIELELEARNIFGRDNFEFQEFNGNRIEINSFEVGRRFSASLSVDF
ncbi:TonB-dependent receptor domain-containing protein [Qipengyuania spongiae]|uniref:TonB-dependent receptor n=1 Tax=Qipengyuania spongiae TaxID=2909673 RepID=A0ABY5SXK0_9SPHN|nr:TonB-dependent receptor [Qipengyuania spongiae]UVI39262.1 TonB-dependent receptor [Qipengyuania spongiae]